MSKLHADYYADSMHQINASLERNDQMGEGTFLIRVAAEPLANTLVPGQFVMIRLSGTNARSSAVHWRYTMSFLTPRATQHGSTLCISRKAHLQRLWQNLHLARKSPSGGLLAMALQTEPVIA